MKKLFIAFVSAVSFALFAKADPIDFTSPTGTSFENAEVGAFSLEQQDEDGSSYWYSTGDEFGQITEGAPVYSGDRPAMFQNATQLKYFEIDSVDRLYRSAYALPDGGEAQPVNIGTGVYFDSLVRFAAAEAGRAPEAGDKIGLWFKAVAAEDDPKGVGVTNLMVKAAYLEEDNSVTVKDYAITKLDGQAISAADNLVPDSWHRVTIKALADASSVEGSVGFVVFIDGKVAASDEVKGDDDSFLASLNPTALAWADKDAFFPSMVAAGTEGGDTITSAAFLGVGAVDDVSFTPNAPTFAADSRFFTVKWDPEAFNSLMVNGQTMDVADGTCDIGGVGNEVAVVCELVDNYVVTGAVCDANSSFDLASMKFTLTGTSVATLLTQKRMFKVGDDYYETFVDALEAAEDGGTVQLAADIELEEPLSIEDMDITIDLAGHDITICAESEPAIGGSGEANITIIDSIGGGEVSNTDESDPVAVYTEGSLTIGAHEGDMGASFNAPVDADGEFLIIAGKFYDELTGKPGDDFGKIATGSTVSEDVDADGYWVVTAGEPPPPVDDDCEVTFYDVTGETSVFEHFTYKAYIGTEELTVIDNQVTVKQGASVKVVSIPNQGYEYVLDPEHVTEWVYIDEDGNLVSIEEIGEEETDDIILIEPTEIPATDVQISLPAATEGVAGYIVSNVTDNVAISADVQEEPVVGGATYTLPIGAKIEIWVVPADGYRVTGNPYVINEVTSGTTVDVQDLPSVAAIAYVAQIGDDKYETLQEAFAAVQALETAGTFPIVITALADDGLTITDTDRTASIEKDVTITIPSVGSWEVSGVLTYSGVIEGTVAAADIVILDGGSITLGVNALVTVGLASELDEDSFTAPDGYKVMVMSTMDAKSFKVVEVPTYAITWTDPENATVVAIDEEGYAVESGDEYSEGCEIVFTVTPKENYTYTGVELGTAWTLLESGAISNLVTMGAEPVAVTIPEAVAAAPAWDIPGAEGGINALVKEDGTKYVEFTSVTFTATGATVGLHAKEINANGQVFGLVCKTDITKGYTFVINATLNYEQGELGTPTEGLFTITADLSEYDQLFVVGVGPAAADPE